MKIEVSMKFVFDLYLTRDDILPLIVLAQHHYDSACIATARQGGFLHTWLGRVSAFIDISTEEQVSCSATWRDLDILLKVCEGVAMAERSKLITLAQRTKVDTLCATIMNAMKYSTQNSVPVHTVSAAGPQDRLQWSTHPGRY